MKREPNKKRNIIVLITIAMLIVLLWMVTSMSVNNYDIYADYLQESELSTDEAVASLLRQYGLKQSSAHE